MDSLIIGILNSDKVRDQANILIANGAKIGVLFAPGTDQADPGAKPEIWTDAAGFKAADDKFINDAKVFLTAPNRIAFATALLAVQADCTACHQAYRITPTPPAAVARAGAPSANQVVALANTASPAAAGAGQPAAAAGGAQPAGAGGRGAGRGNANAALGGGGFIDRAPTPQMAAATVKVAAPSIGVEVSAAQIAARSGSRNIGRIEDIHNRMQRAINCLEGPKGPDFDKTVLNPCADSGNGVIPDSPEAAKKAKYQEVVEKLKGGLAVTDRQGGQQVALDAADAIVAISSGS